jgi:hypothetical protein
MTTDERLDRIDKSIQDLHELIAGQTRYVQEFRTEVIRRFDDIDRRMDTMVVTVGSIDSRMPGLTRSVMAMEARVYKQDDTRDTKIAELEARIRKLEGAA